MRKVNSILLIDDDQDDKYFFNKALEEVDPEIVLYTAGEGNDALEKLKFIAPDLILLDLVMPGMNGAAFLKSFKADPRISHIPVIIYTTSLSIFGKDDILKLGAYDIYIKPLDFNETVCTIREIIESVPSKKSA